MGFHKSSNGINVKDKHILTAYCQKPGGETTYSELDLDGFIGVNKGKDHPNSVRSVHGVSLMSERPYHTIIYI